MEQPNNKDRSEPVAPVTAKETSGRRMLSLFLGGVAGNLAAVLAILGSVALNNRVDLGMALAVFNVGLTPVIVGMTSAWCWRRLRLTVGGQFLHTLWLAGLGLAGAALMFGEGFLCLLMAAPLYYFVLLVSVMAGCRLFQPGTDRLRVTLIPALVIAAWGEARLAPPPARDVFTDELRIKASPHAVWPHVVSFGPIQAPANFWMFRLGLPYPVETPPGGDAVGRERLCVFNQGAVFRERVSAFEPNQRLRFDIVEQPRGVRRRPKKLYPMNR